MAKKERGKKKKTEGEPGRHNYKLHRYTQITRLLCASQPPDDHAVHMSSVVAREKQEKEQETEMKRKKERESKLSWSTHNYRLYFQIAACTLAASSNCLRR